MSVMVRRVVECDEHERRLERLRDELSGLADDGELHRLAKRQFQSAIAGNTASGSSKLRSILSEETSAFGPGDERAGLSDREIIARLQQIRPGKYGHINIDELL